MKIEARLFLVVAVFCWLAAIGYGIWTAAEQLQHGHVEPVGVAALILSGGLLGIPGSFFWFVSRRIDPRPEDRSDAEIAEMAGDLGFFSPGSYWPIGIAGAATMAGLALAFVAGVAARSSASSADCSPSAACCSSTTSAVTAPCSSARRATAPQVESRTPSGAGSRCLCRRPRAGVRRSACATTGPS